MKEAAQEDNKEAAKGGVLFIFIYHQQEQQQQRGRKTTTGISNQCNRLYSQRRSSDSRSLRRQTDFCIRLFCAFVVVSAVVVAAGRVLYFLRALFLFFVFSRIFSSFFFWLEPRELRVCNPIFKRVKSICEQKKQNKVCKKSEISWKKLKATNALDVGDREYENYTKRRSGNKKKGKIESSSNNMCQKG